MWFPSATSPQPVCTVQVDTFETVRENAGALLASLAQHFEGRQLDTLFAKLEASAAKPQADHLQIMQLLFKLSGPARVSASVG